MQLQEIMPPFHHVAPNVACGAQYEETLILAVA
jgi:hypothetical protein